MSEGGGKIPPHFSTVRPSAGGMFQHSPFIQELDTQLTLCASPCAPRIPSHGHCLLVIDDIIQISECAREFPSVDCLGCFTCVLEGDTKIGTTGSGRFLGRDLVCCVADL